MSAGASAAVSVLSSRSLPELLSWVSGNDADRVLSGSDVTIIPDRGTMGGSWVSTGPNYPTVSAWGTLPGTPAVSIAGVTSNFDSSLTPEDWSFLGTRSGQQGNYTVIQRGYIFASDGLLIGTAANVTTQTGIVMSRVGTELSFVAGSETEVADVTIVGGSWPSNAVYTLGVRRASGVYRPFVNSIVPFGSGSTVTDANEATYAMYSAIGPLNTPNIFAERRIYAGALSDSQLSRVIEELETRWPA